MPEKRDEETERKRACYVRSRRIVPKDNDRGQKRETTKTKKIRTPKEVAAVALKRPSTWTGMQCEKLVIRKSRKIQFLRDIETEQYPPLISHERGLTGLWIPLKNHGVKFEWSHFWRSSCLVSMAMMEMRSTQLEWCSWKTMVTWWRETDGNYQ